jgi:hypothetical protein
MAVTDEVQFSLIAAPSSPSTGMADAAQAEEGPPHGEGRAVPSCGFRGRRVAAGVSVLVGLAVFASLTAKSGVKRPTATLASARAGLSVKAETGSRALSDCKARRLTTARRLSIAKDCQTPKRDDECHDMVTFLLSKGIELQPSLYGGLTPDSPFEKVQERVNTMFPKVCAPPCFNAADKSTGTEDELEDELAALGLEDPCEDVVVEDDDKIEANHNCKTAVPGDDCYDHVIWVATDGIIHQPRMFKGINMATSLHDIQVFLAENPDVVPEASCGRPCKDKCHDAIEGEPCHTNVKWAMTDGINDPNGSLWFPHLTNKSSFAEFQAAISADGDATVDCPMPCKKFCRTATEGEKCFEAVDWVMKVGVRKSPESYKGISIYSSFEEVQRHLAKNKTEAGSHCVEPCVPGAVP